MVVDLYREKLSLLEQTPHIQILVVIPHKWKEAEHLLKTSQNGVNIKKISTIRFWGFHGATFLFGFSIINYIKNFKPDIIHIEEEYYSLVLYEILKVKKMFSPKSKCIFFTSQNINKNFLFPFNRIENYVLRNTDGAITVNSEAASILLKKGFDKPITTMPQFGINPEIFRQRKNRERNKKFCIGFIGRLEEVKGIDTLLNAAAGLKIEYEIWIVVEGPQSSSLQVLATKLGIATKLRIFNGISHEEIPQFLQKMDVLILPSRTTSKIKEQFGRVLIEAMACGVPVIGSNSGAIPEVIGDGGLIFVEDSYKELRNQILRLNNNFELWCSLATRGRKRVLEHFTISVIAQKTLNFYNEILQ